MGESMGKFIFGVVFLISGLANASVSWTTTDNGPGPQQFVKKGDQFTYAVTGTFTGSLRIERSTNAGLNWDTVVSVTSATTSGKVLVTESAVYRWRAYSYLGGASTSTITDANASVPQEKEFYNSLGDSIGSIQEYGIDVQGLTVTGGATIAGDVTMPSGSITSTIWNIGADSGTSTHVVNGSLFATNSLTVGGNTTGDSNLGTISSVAFDKYYEGSFSMTFTGPFTSSQVVTVRYRKVGKTVTLQIPAVYAACSVASSIVSSAAVPTGVGPYATFQQTINASDNTVKLDTGWVRFQQGNVINIFKNAAAASFAATGSCGWEYPLNFSYITN